MEGKAVRLEAEDGGHTDIRNASIIRYCERQRRSWGPGRSPALLPFFSQPKDLGLDFTFPNR